MVDSGFTVPQPTAVSGTTMIVDWSQLEQERHRQPKFGPGAPVKLLSFIQVRCSNTVWSLSDKRSTGTYDDRHECGYVSRRRSWRLAATAVGSGPVQHGCGTATL